MALIFNLEKARKILVDILKHVALPENSKRLSEAKCKNILVTTLENIFKYFVLFSELWPRDDQNNAIRLSYSHGASNGCDQELWLQRP